VTVGGEAPVTPVSSLDSSSLNLSYKPCDNKDYFENCEDDIKELQGIQFKLSKRYITSVIKVKVLFTVNLQRKTKWSLK
jgi:hypothetical protein